MTLPILWQAKALRDSYERAGKAEIKENKSIAAAIARNRAMSVVKRIIAM